jgi:hypothetical protein
MISQIRDWLSPPEFSEALEKARELREDGTSYWIFEEPRFKDWRQSEWSIKPMSNAKKMSASTLWVHGKDPQIN